MSKLVALGGCLLLACVSFLSALALLPIVPASLAYMAFALALVAVLIASASASPDTLDGASKGCWAAVQIGYTLIRFRHLWPRDAHAGAWLQIYLAAPARSQLKGTGYERVHWGIWFMPNFKLSGSHFRLGISWRGPHQWCVLPAWMTYA